MNTATKSFNGKAWEISLNGKVVVKSSKKSFTHMVIARSMKTQEVGCYANSTSEKSANSNCNWWAKNQVGIADSHQVIEIKEI